MKNNDALKKHHFWILAGLAPLLTFLAVIFILTDAGGAAAAAKEKQQKELASVKGVTPKGTLAMTDLEKQKADLAVQREKLWKSNYELQKSVFGWPTNPDLQALEARFTKFGEPMPPTVVRNDEFNTFKSPTVYQAAYAAAAKTILPTTFRGDDWRSVLRFVSGWGEKTPTDKQIWLALEDLWVQRGLLEPVKTVNDDAARFEPAQDVPGSTDLKRTFRSKVWELELEVPTAGPEANKLIRAKLKNRTDRLQLLGVGNVMRLEVRLSDRGAPVLFRIEADFVKAEETLAVVPKPAFHGIPPGTDVKRLTSVRQVLDDRTVPIRRVETIELGYKDDRHSKAPLKSPEWWKDPEPTAGTGTGNPMMPGGPPPGSSGGGPPPMMGDPRGGGSGMGGGGATTAAKSGGPTAVLDANKNRYVEVTGQVRRMPVGVVLLVDQMFMQDALTAYANSGLRFQITQYHWRRFRGTMTALATGGTTTGGAALDDYVLPPTATDRGVSAGSSGGPPPMGPGGPSYPMGGMGGSGYGGSGGSSGVSDGQVTSGLVELTIYGIVTLYEKYEVKTDGAAGTSPGTPAPDAEATTPAADPAPAAPKSSAPAVPADPKEDATPPAADPKADAGKTDAPAAPPADPKKDAAPAAAPAPQPK